MFNLKLDSNQKYIVVSLILCSLLCSYISPVIIKDIYTKLPSEWIAFESLVGSISGFLITGEIYEHKRLQRIKETTIYF